MTRRRTLLAALMVITLALMVVWPRERVTLAAMFITGSLVVFEVDKKGVRR
jgi:hypothetical protein